MQWQFDDGQAASRVGKIHTGHKPYSCPEAGDLIETLRVAQLAAAAPSSGRLRWFLYGVAVEAVLVVAAAASGIIP